MGERLDKLLVKLTGMPASDRQKPPEPPPTFWQWLSAQPDALGILMGLSKMDSGRYSTRLGYSNGDWISTTPNTHTLVLGPSQSAAGKTSGYMIPIVLTQFGPVVASSTKLDLARNTAMARSRLGKVWHYDPSGAPPPWPGLEELRWSPISEAKDWSAALEISRQMVAASDPDAQARGKTRSDAGQFFDQLSADLIACLMHYAALTGKDIGFVTGMISNGDPPEHVPIVNELRAMGREAVWRTLNGIVLANDRTRADIFLTAKNALRGYQGDAIKTATKVNFIPDNFVLGHRELPSELHFVNPDGKGERLLGSYDTVYITVPAHQQSLYAPLVIGLLSAIKRAVYKNHAYDERHDLTGGRQPVTFVLDEMYGSPLPDLPALLSEGGGQGLLICGALQDLTQAVARWGEVGHGFLTLWQNVLVLPGIRDDRTLELLSKLTGERNTFVETENWQEQQIHSTTAPYLKTWVRSIQVHVQRERVIPFEDIATGNLSDPSEVLLFQPNGGWQKLNLMKYWADQPWPGILLQSADWVLNGPNYGSVMDERHHNWDLPFPNLMRGGNAHALHAAGGQDMVNWYLTLQRDWESKQLPESVGASS